MPFSKHATIPILISLAIMYCQLGCTCEYEFTYRGQVLGGQDQQPLPGAEVRTIEFDLYAIDPEEYNQYTWGEEAYSDSSGNYTLITSGLYDCGLGRAEIDDPGDLGWIYFHFGKEGYVPVDTAFRGGSLPNRGSFWEIPTVSLVREDSATVR